jgi:hypothetical protein
MNDLFDFEITQASPDFVALRDDPHNAQMKKLAQEMWRAFSVWADPTFPQQFACNGHSRFWEMYLGICLIERNFQIVRKQSSHGPDLHITIDGINLWIEATAPEESVGIDAVPSIYEHKGYEPVPEDKIILRFTNAISEKIKKREDYIKKGVIGSNDAFVIALNGGRISMTLLEGPLPAIIGSVYPAGDYSVIFDVNKLEIIREGYKIRDHISKSSGSAVPTNSFLDPKYSCITGILYSNAALWDMPTKPGCELLYIDNSVANIHLKPNWLGIGKYCYLENHHLTIITQQPCA